MCSCCVLPETGKSTQCFRHILEVLKYICMARSSFFILLLGCAQLPRTLIAVTVYGLYSSFVCVIDGKGILVMKCCCPLHQHHKH